MPCQVPVNLRVRLDASMHSRRHAGFAVDLAEALLLRFLARCRPSHPKRNKVCCYPIPLVNHAQPDMVAHGRKRGHHCKIVTTAAWQCREPFRHFPHKPRRLAKVDPVNRAGVLAFTHKRLWDFIKRNTANPTAKLRVVDQCPNRHGVSALSEVVPLLRQII